ncbi:hypothetical protein BSAJGB5T_03025 [Bacillus safensis]|nr:hypothetical protein BSAJGB5T_03025 [Bacillus safensis]
MILILALCLLFSVIKNLGSPRKDEHRSAGLTPNARVCLRARFHVHLHFFFKYTMLILNVLICEYFIFLRI